MAYIRVQRGVLPPLSIKQSVIYCRIIFPLFLFVGCSSTPQQTEHFITGYKTQNGFTRIVRSDIDQKASQIEENRLILHPNQNVSISTVKYLYTKGKIYAIERQDSSQNGMGSVKESLRFDSNGTIIFNQRVTQADSREQIELNEVKRFLQQAKTTLEKSSILLKQGSRLQQGVVKDGVMTHCNGLKKVSESSIQKEILEQGTYPISPLTPLYFVTIRTKSREELLLMSSHNLCQIFSQ